MQNTVSELLNRFESAGNACPSGRLLPEPLSGGEEWHERGTIDGKGVTICFYFDAEEVAAAKEACEHNPSEGLPFDAEHVVYITDDDYVQIFSKNLAGFSH